MLEAIVSALSSLSPTLLLWMTAGVVVGQVVAVIPGLGGVMAMVLLLPFTYTMDPDAAIAMLLAAAATAGTGNTITGVLFGVPGSAMGVATVFDGYPMAQRGQAGRALGAGLLASAVGGIIGAIGLAAIIPVVRPIVQQIGPAEFFALVLIAMVAISRIGEGDTWKSLVAGGLGLMLAFVGQEPSTGTLRYAFGSLYLWDGIALVPAIVGLFALSEMISLTIGGNPIASDDAGSPSTSGVVAGLRDVLVQWRITMSSSLLGTGIGVLPGMGGVAAQFLAYAQAERLSKNEIPFGQGAVEGIIGSDAATNAKDGGSLVPTLAFGIPGSAPMAVLLGALLIHGVQPGPSVLTERLDTVWLLIFVLILANIVAVALCLSFSDLLARITRVRAAIIVPSVVTLSLFGAYLESNRAPDILVALAFGVIGYVMQRHRYSRATLVIGLVLGGILERNYLLMTQLYGWDAIQRRPFLAIVGVALLVAAGSTVRARRRARRDEQGSPL